uniref:Nonaspanin n=1 Tax=Tanacetum cinerariifolium TaxID=118510 RepID=A0A6L2N7P4_TANCI|nr:nonaspanin [Tanacetum cinerariifolium]
MASAIICLANNQKFNFSKYILENMVKNLEARVKLYMFPRFVQVFVNHQLGDMSHHKGIFVNPSLTKKVFANMKIVRIGFSEAITSLFETMMVQDPKEMGEIPTDTQDIPILTQPSSSQPQKKHKPRRKQRKETEDRLQLNELMKICTKFFDRVLSLEQIKNNQADEIEKLKKRVKKLEGKKKKRTHRQKRMYKVGLSARIVSSDEEGLGDQEDASKQGRSIADIDQDEGTTLVDDTQERMNEEDLFGVHDLDGDEVFVDVSARKKKEHSENVAEKKVSTADPVTTAGEVVTIAGEVVTTADVEPKAITTVDTTVIAVSTRAKKKEITMQEPSETPFPKPIVSSQQPSQPKDKGKAKMVEPERPLKRKDQIMMDEQIVRDLEAQMKAMMDADCELAAKLQEEERGELFIEEKSKLFVELMNKRKKHFERLRAKEKRRKPPTKAQKRNQMFKDRAVESSKRAGDEIEQESAKKQKLDENVQAKVADDDTAELKRCLEIVPEDDDDVAIEATPLSSKSPAIVDYKIYREGNKSYFKIIKADGNSQNYLTFRKIYKNFNREELKVLRSIVKERFKKTNPVDDMDNLFFQTLKTMFEHHINDNIWKYQQGAVKVHNWKLIDSRGAYCVTTKNMVYYLLVEKIYPFTNNILHQLWKDVRFQVDYEVEMAYDLFRLIRRQINEGLKLAIVKCLNSQEYLSALGAAISRAIEKGMQDRLSADIDHGKAGRSLADVVAYNPAAEADYNFTLQRLREVDFPLLAELKSHKNASVMDIMNLLRLDGPLANALGMNDLQPNVDQLSLLVHRSEDQVVLGTDGPKDAQGNGQGNVAFFPTIEFEKEELDTTPERDPPS